VQDFGLACDRFGSVASHVIRPGSQSISAVPPQADIALVRALGAFNHAFTVRAAKAEHRLGLDNIV